MKKLISTGVVHFVYILSCLIPRTRNMYLCIGWHKSADGQVLADNTKYFYLYLSEQKNIRAIWLGKSKNIVTLLRARGLEAYYEESFLGYWYSLTSGFYVIDAFLQPKNYMLSGQARIIQLLHGKGMKKKGYSEKQPRTQNLICNTSPFAISLLPESFKKDATLVVTGYPRNDQFFREVKNADISVDADMRTHIKNLKQKGTRTILYAPTFRRGEKEFAFGGINIETLRTWARKNNVHILLSLHNKYRNQQTERELTDSVSSLLESDIYPLLSHIDVLITDYSSSFVDFLLLDRPIVFYPYDLKEYSEREGIIHDYNSMTPGPKAYTFEELLSTLETVLTNDTWAEKREEIRNLYHTHKDGNVSERIFQTIQDNYFK